MNNNKILIIVISVIVLSSMGITFYFLNSDVNIANTTDGVPTTTEGEAFPVSNSITGADTTQNNNQDGNGDITVNSDNEQVPESASVQIKKISNVAVAGITFINKNGQNILRYIEKGNGNIKEIAFDETIPTSVTNTTITAIFDSFWSNDGESLIFKRLDGPNNVIQTIFGTINENLEAINSGVEIKKLDTTLLPQNILEVAVSPDKKRAVYMIREGENTIGVVSDFNKTGPSNPKTQIWKSPIKEWSVSWPSLNSISLLTKPSSGIKGYLYSLGVGIGNQLEKIIGDVPGLTAIKSLTGEKLIYSETTGTGFLTYIIDNEEEGMDIFPVRTIPEKCVFSKINENVLYCGVPSLITGSKYPDSWYQGLVSFSDNIYKIDLDVNFSGIIAGREKMGGEGVDLINPILSDDENYLAFINKKDSTPWIVKIR